MQREQLYAELKKETQCSSEINDALINQNINHFNQMIHPDVYRQKQFDLVNPQPEHGNYYLS